MFTEEPTRRVKLKLILGALLVIASSVWIARSVLTLGEKSNVAGRTVIDLRGAAPLAIGRSAPAEGLFSPLLAISHDGSLVVYVGSASGTTRLFKRALGESQVESIRGTEGARHAFFSPDDRWIGFLTRDKIQKISVDGGLPVVLSNVVGPVRATWGRDGTIVIIADHGAAVKRISESGREISTFQPEADSPCPFFFGDILPDGTTMIAEQRCSPSGDFANLVIYDLRTHSITSLRTSGYDARYAAPGYLFFARGGDLHVVRFDAKQRRLTAKSVVLQRGVTMESLFGRGQYALSDQGTLAFVPGRDRSVGRPAWVDLAGAIQFLPMPELLYRTFHLSPDGRKLAIELTDVEESILISFLEGNRTRHLPMRGRVRDPKWTASGESLTVAKAPSRSSQFAAIEVSDEGRILRTLVSEENAAFFPHAMSNDGRTLVGLRKAAGGPRELRVLTFDDSPASRVVDSASPTVSDLSSDGKWLAYTSTRTGREEVWVSPLNDLKSTAQISIEGGVEPQWCSSCPDLYYRKGRRWYGVRFWGDDAKWDPPRPLWETDFVNTLGPSYDVSPDGKRLLVSKPSNPDVIDQILLVHDWIHLLPVEMTPQSK